MAVTAAVCNSFKHELLSMTPHTAGDTYKVALYLQAGATLSKSTTVYTATGEVTGVGYDAGGKELAGFAVNLTGDTACLDFTDAAWTGATITADAALIYNSSRSNKAVCVLTFGSTTSTAGTWTLSFPAPGASGLLTIA